MRSTTFELASIRCGVLQHVVVLGWLVLFCVIGDCQPATGQSPPSSTALPISQTRVVVTGPETNRPDPFPGAGDFGWAGNLQQLPGGRLLLVHQAGYWHVSFAQPRVIEPELAARWRDEGWPLDFPAPTGGRSMLSVSDDGGQTWSKPRTILDLPQDDSPYGLIRLADGTLLCFVNVQASWYGYDRAPPELADTLGGLNSRQCVIRSADEGETWGDPIWLDSPGKLYERSHAQPIALPGGGILWPTYCREARTGDEYGVIHRSDNAGRTWRVASTIRRNANAVDEPAIARLADGRLMLVCRPDGAVFHSRDDGVTWKETGSIPVTGTFKAPRLFVLGDGTIVCAATVGTLSAFISTDGGRTWSRRIAIDDGAYGYPGGVLLADESILVSYVERGRAPSRIFVARVALNADRSGLILLPLER